MAIETRNNTGDRNTGKRSGSTSGAGGNVGETEMGRSAAVGSTASGTFTRGETRGEEKAGGTNLEATRRKGEVEPINMQEAAASIAEKLPEAIVSVVDEAIQGLEPKIHEAVTDIAGRVVNYSHSAAREISDRARRNPWIVVGGVALLLAGLGLIFNMEERRRGEVAEPSVH